MRDAHPYRPQPPTDRDKDRCFPARRGRLAGRWSFGWLVVAALGVLYGPRPAR
jgi:hypothetical protein